MFKLFKKNISLFLIIGLSWSAISIIGETRAYFNDAEMSEENIFQAGTLDFELDSTVDFSPEIALGVNSTRIIQVNDFSTTDYNYRVRVENPPVGDLCNHLKLKDDLTGIPVYLKDFISDEVSYSVKCNWEFTAITIGDISAFAGQTCSFDLVYEGWQNNMNYGVGGFSDVERISNVISAESYNPTPGDKNSKPDKTSGPADHVVINEVQIKEQEFIELYNPTNKDIPMDGWELCYYSSSRNWDEPTNHKTFPSGTELVKHSFYLIAIKEEDNFGVNDDWNLGYSSYRFSNENGSIAIFPDNNYSETNYIDAVAWGIVDYVKEDLETKVPSNSQSIERGLTGYDDNDNSIDFIIKNNPTPTNSSGNGMPNIVINEFLASGVNYNDFVEIYNGSNSDFEAGWKIKIESCGNSLSISGSSKVTPGDWAVVTLTSDDILCENKGVITLYDKNSNEIDKISYYDANTADSSFARIPDGSPNWVDPIPTPGGTNTTPENLILADMDLTMDYSIKTITDEIVVAEEFNNDFDETAENADDADNSNEEILNSDDGAAGDEDGEKQVSIDTVDEIENEGIEEGEGKDGDLETDDGDVETKDESDDTDMEDEDNDEDNGGDDNDDDNFIRDIII